MLPKAHFTIIYAVNIFFSVFLDLLQTHQACPVGEKCVPHIQCPSHFHASQVDDVPHKCLLSSVDQGLCCKTGGGNHNGRRTLRSSSDNMVALINEAKRQYAEIMANEPHLAASRVEKGQPEDFHNMVFK
jgi:hypothetical protein